MYSYPVEACTAILVGTDGTSMYIYLVEADGTSMYSYLVEDRWYQYQHVQLSSGEQMEPACTAILWRQMEPACTAI